MINRSAVIIRPKKLYIEWASKLDDSGILPNAHGEPSMYLMPEYDDDAGAWALLEHTYDAIFDLELEAWHTDTKDWPNNRSFSMFCDWFEVTFVSAIEDLCDGPIVDD